MCKMLILTLLLFLSKSSFSQSYIEAYRYGIPGSMYGEQGNPDSAEKYLLKALDVVPDKSWFPAYFSLLKMADNHKDTVKIAKYLRELSCIYPKDTIYRLLKEFGEVMMDVATFNRLYHAKCTLSETKKYSSRHPRAIDSIIVAIRDRDQGIRTRVNDRKRKGALTEAEMIAFEKEMRNSDSVNFIVLYGCMKRYGFPCLDYPLNGSLVTQIMHIDNYMNFKKVDGYLLKAIKGGCLNPKDYAYALDRSLIASGLTPKYYWFLAGSEETEKYKPTQDELMKVNHERQLIGLPTYPQWTGWGF